MLTKDAIKHFGTRTALADALGIAPESTHDWGRKVPDLRQLQLEIITRRALKAEERVRNPGRRAA